MDLDQLRLTRIEDKLDKLTDAIIAIARAEEKLINLEKDDILLGERMQQIDHRLSAIEANANQGIGVGKLLTPIWGGAIGVICTSIVAYFNFKK